MNAYLWALLTALTWGCVPIIEKAGLNRIPALPGLFYRSMGVIFGMLILLAFKLPQIKSVFRDEPSGWLYLIAGGFLASFVGQLFFYNALRSGEASRVVPLAATYPLISFVLGVIFLSEKVTLTKITGIMAIVIGAFLLK